MSTFPFQCYNYLVRHQIIGDELGCWWHPVFFWLLVGVYSHCDNMLWSFQTLLALHADILPGEEYLSPQKIVEYIGSRTPGGRDATQSIGKAEFMQCATVSKTMAAILEVGWGLTDWGTCRIPRRSQCANLIVQWTTMVKSTPKADWLVDATSYHVIMSNQSALRSNSKCIMNAFIKAFSQHLWKYWNVWTNV